MTTLSTTASISETSRHYEAISPEMQTTYQRGVCDGIAVACDRLELVAIGREAIALVGMVRALAAEFRPEVD